jgi:hypothetical protein
MGMSPEEIVKLAEALRRADYMNWTAQEVAEKISGAIEGIVDSREAELREALRQCEEAPYA